MSENKSPGIEKTEQEVLNVYMKVNPSKYEIEDKEEFNRTKQRITNLFLNNLKFPMQLFNNAEVLDLGCGTGEHTLILAMHGAKISAVEMNPISVERAKSIFKLFELQDNLRELYHGSLFDYDAGDKKFDITISNGVIHHTEDPERGFKKLVQNLKPNGFTILGVGNVFGQFQRNLQRYIVFKFSGDDEVEIKKNAYLLFKEHLDRAVKFGRRTLDSIIYDQFVNPKIKTFSVSTILDWFSNHGIEFYSSWPNVNPFILSDSAYTSSSIKNNQFFSDIGILSELYWMANYQDDIDRWKETVSSCKKLSSSLNKVEIELNDVNYNNFAAKQQQFLNLEWERILADYSEVIQSTNKSEHFKYFFRELKTCLDLCDSNNLEKLIVEIKNFKYLFKGASGVGMNFFVGYKK